MALLHGDMRLEKQFSLDMPDADTEAYFVEFLKDQPRRLREAVAANPLVATRCFHWTVRLVIRCLFIVVDLVERSSWLCLIARSQMMHHLSNHICLLSRLA